MDVLRGQTGFFDGVSVFARFANGGLDLCYSFLRSVGMAVGCNSAQMGGSTLNTVRTPEKCVLVWLFVRNNGAKCVEIQHCV